MASFILGGKRTENLFRTEKKGRKGKESVVEKKKGTRYSYLLNILRGEEKEKKTADL